MLLLAFKLDAQNYFDHWAFGTNVHIDFTSGTPSVSCNTSINSSEAAAVWSNPVTGDFIAYTSGTTVYNGQTHNVLANGTGLIANASSIESALILPKPGASIDEFYIFHNNITNTYWSEADISQGTNGTVGSKNNFLAASGSERCGTVPHGTLCPAYWVMISKGVNDSVAAYLVDTNGISSTPVVSATGITGGNARGNIVFSEDRTMVGMSVENKGMYVAPFNNNTGQTGTWVKIGTTTNGFGSAFSPDGTKVYYTSGYGQNVYQYNFSNTTETYLGGSGLSYLALAPDGKIYISKYGQQTLGVINSPNLAGTASSFQISGLTISGPSTCVCRWGLPNPFHVDIGYTPSHPDTITLCPGEDTLYTSLVSGDSFLWNTGATTQSILLDSQGLYYATIGFGDCASFDSVYLQYVSDVEISANTVCQSDTTIFSHYTAMPVSNISSYLWNFGDGSTSTLPNPWHLYNIGDTFNVTLSVTTNSGCVLDTNLEVVVHPNPIPEFSFENVCDGNYVTFQDDAIEGSAAIIARSWDVTNNGTTEYANSNPSHLYSTFGQYAVEFKVEDALGCIDSMVKLVFIHPNPVAEFSVENECLHVIHAFADSSDVALGNITQWNWTFGDGQSSSIASPDHLYATAGSKFVTLTVTSDSGCVDAKTKNTQVYHLPIASFHADSTCENLGVIFNENSTSQSGSITQFFWEFGDGSNAAAQSPIHDYAGPGLYDVDHVVISNYGCIDSISHQVRILPAPNTAFGCLNKVCQGDPLPFYDQSVIANVTPGGDQIVSWDWQLNGNFFSSDTNPVYQTSAFESFHVKLTTTSNYGCTTFSENVAQIFPTPKALLEREPACQLAPSKFSSLSTIPAGLVSEWLWDFGDGSFSTVENPEHSYQWPGQFPIELAISSNKGCVDTVRGSILIPETPKVNFDVDPTIGCTDLHVLFKNQSAIDEGGLSYQWYVNDRIISTERNPSEWLTNDTLAPLLYSVKLSVSSDLGCAASKLKTDLITVFPKPKAKFTYDFDDFAMFDPSVEFSNNSEQGIRWSWNFGDGAKSSDFAPQHFYEKHGKYAISLTTWNTYNCPDSTHDIIVIDPITQLYVPTAFTPNGDGDNDFWGVKGFNEGNRFNIKIWDRWGHLVYESSEMDFSWNGYMSNGELAPIGTYAYVINFETSELEVKEITGQFSLLQ